MYAVGVVGAIAVNLGSCSFNRELSLGWFQRFIMVSTFLVLFAVEVTIAKTKPDALFFACTVLGIGLTLRFYSHKLSGLTTLTVTRKIAEMVVPDLPAAMQPRLEEGQKIMVAARGINPVLNFALEEAQLRKAVLCVVYVKEVVVYFSAAPGATGRRPKWQDDREVGDTVTLVAEYPGGLRHTWTGTLASSFEGEHDIFFGSDAAVLTPPPPSSAADFGNADLR